MLVSEAIQYLSTFTFTSSSLNDDERIDALLKSLNLAHYEIYRRFWHIPDFEVMEEIAWPNLDITTFNITRENSFKIKHIYSDIRANIEKNIFNKDYLDTKNNPFKVFAGKIYLERKPLLFKQIDPEGLETQQYISTIIYVPQPKKLVLESGNLFETEILPYNDVFFDALLAKALLYHHSTLDGTNPKFREWQTAYNEKIKFLDGYYYSDKR